MMMMMLMMSMYGGTVRWNLGRYPCKGRSWRLDADEGVAEHREDNHGILEQDGEVHDPDDLA